MEASSYLGYEFLPGSEVAAPSLPLVPDAEGRERAEFELARKQMNHFGALLSFEIAGGLESARSTFDALQRSSRRW